MGPVIVGLTFAALSLWGELYLLGMLTWFGPNLFLASALLLILHWRGPEGHFLAVGFGLLADCYSSAPFGVYGLAFLLLSFPVRWYGLKMFQEAVLFLPVVVIFFSLACNGLIYILLYLLLGENRFQLGWLKDLLGRDAIPLGVLSVPMYLLLLRMEDLFQIRLSLRKF